MKQLKQKHKARHKGVTMIEILLYLVISSIIVGTITTLSFFLLESFVKSKTITTIESEGAFVLRTIENVSKQSSEIQSPSIGAIQTSITFSLTDTNRNPTVFDRDADRIRMQEGVKSYYLTSQNISIDEFIITNLSNEDNSETFRVQVTLRHKNPMNRWEYEYSQTFITTFVLRKSN